MDTKKFLNLLKSGEAVISFIIALAALLGAFLAPQFIKYIVILAIWIISSVLFFVIYKSIKKNNGSWQSIIIVAGFFVITGWVFWLLSDFIPNNYPVIPFPESKYGILLAEFTYGETGENYPAGREQRDVLYEDMQNMLGRSDLNLNNIVMIQKYGPIQSQDDAQRIGQNLNADLVVWGYISTGRSSDMRPSFILLSDKGEELIEPPLVTVRITGDNSTSLLTNRVRAVASYALGMLYLSGDQRIDFNNATKVLGYGILEAQDEYNTSPGQKSDLGYNLALLYVARGRAYAALDHEDDAVNDYIHALDFSPDFNESYIGMGNVYYSRFFDSHDINDLSMAYSNFDKALPTWSAYYGLGLVSYSRGDYQYAVNYFQQALYGALSSNVSLESTTVMKIRFMLGLSYKALDLSELSTIQLKQVCEADTIKSDLRQWACDELIALMITATQSPPITTSETLAPTTPLPPTQLIIITPTAKGLLTNPPIIISTVSTPNVPPTIPPTASIFPTILPTTVPPTVPPTASPLPTIQTHRKQCNDGIDNDSDGYVDTQDPQCKNSGDNDESN